MEDVAILNSTLSVITLLALATITAYSLRKSKFPYTVALVLLGVATGFLAEQVTAFAFLQGFKFSPELVFYIFLPTLIFESAFHINFKQFRQSIHLITWLSTIGVLLNAAIIAACLHYALGIPLITSMLFGVIISPTDPIAVIALFRKLGAPKRLTTIIEGESLSNDGMSLVLFQIILGFAVVDSFEGFKFGGILNSIGISIVGGILIGAIMGWIFAKALDYVKNSKEIEISLTLILAHATFVIADHFFSVSGILATVAAGLVIGNYGAYKISPVIKEIMLDFWDYMSFVANSLLFIIVGSLIWDFKDMIPPMFNSILIVILAVLIAKIIVTYTIIPLVNRLYKKEKVPVSWMHIYLWSSFRGALVMALVLSLPIDLPYYNELLIFSISVIFFTIVFNGLTIEPLLAKLGLKNFSITEEFEYDEAKVLIDKKITLKLDLMHKKGFINHEVYRTLKKIFEKETKFRLNHLRSIFNKTKNGLPSNTLHTLLKRHLFGVERRVYKKLHYYGEVTQDLLGILLHTLDLQVEKIADERVRLGRLTLFNPEGFFVKTLEKFKWDNWSKIIKRKEIMLRYEMYRARVIATSCVLDEIEELQKLGIFPDSQILQGLAKTYEEWRLKAHSKLQRLEIKDYDACEDLKLFLAKKVAHKIELASINEFYSSGIISDKVKNKLLEEVDHRYAQELI